MLKEFQDCRLLNLSNRPNQNLLESRLAYMWGSELVPRFLKCGCRCNAIKVCTRSPVSKKPTRPWCLIIPLSSKAKDRWQDGGGIKKRHTEKLGQVTSVSYNFCLFIRVKEKGHTTEQEGGIWHTAGSKRQA